MNFKEFIFTKSVNELRARLIKCLDKKYPDLKNKDELLKEFDRLVGDPPDKLREQLEYLDGFILVARRQEQIVVDFHDNLGEYHYYNLGTPEL